MPCRLHTLRKKQNSSRAEQSRAEERIYSESDYIYGIFVWLWFDCIVVFIIFFRTDDGIGGSMPKTLTVSTFSIDIRLSYFYASFYDSQICNYKAYRVFSINKTMTSVSPTS